MRLSGENLRGRMVIASDGQVVGEIATLFLDTSKWRVDSFEVKLRKDMADQLGAARGLFHAGTIELPVSMVQSASDTIVLSVTARELRQVVESASQSPPAG
jgi:sporulation protein YlmC with PRC-barrel domain